ncbi:hypothetical protein BIW11_05811 [Tropilaelaps mercedesae]|uniref:SMC hinge domain-containing protein n=1 Tax=Tropilaelaps mercedesae TaxID=418985 RepID=A0A1V9Y0W2_9ACAR|nr:hypothetical protein BIW11_05811 [Tropilaelaps mercedesae]
MLFTFQMIETELESARLDREESDFVQKSLAYLETRLKLLKMASNDKLAQLKRLRLQVLESKRTEENIRMLQVRLGKTEMDLRQAERNFETLELHYAKLIAQKQALIQTAFHRTDGALPEAENTEDVRVKRELRNFENKSIAHENKLKRLADIKDIEIKELKEKIEALNTLQWKLDDARKVKVDIEIKSDNFRREDEKIIRKLINIYHQRLSMSQACEDVLEHFSASMGPQASVHSRIIEILGAMECTEVPHEDGFFGCVLDHIKVSEEHQIAVCAATSFLRSFVVKNFDMALRFKNALAGFSINVGHIRVIPLDTYNYKLAERVFDGPMGTTQLGEHIQISVS